ncbi:calcium-binding protein [Oscillatoria sp. FACHB-1407]|uniref:calcium-binding protein n=1 Tax=Oscillatoria sp. FACHB-1407 TaxID=2692847 RepID=UPI001684337C|nr:calcium-binding protein [Oscillatoria sp. FACHB-1407]MBD2461979.1 calcium-binding protein [Oscillatoria sp. FACHB-1407]
MNINGTDNSDFLIGSSEVDTIFAYGGHDSVFGKEGDDTIDLGAGDDFAYAGAGNDFVVGGLGQDRLYGFIGEDRLIGNEGDDYLDGEAGNDVMEGGLGNDSYYVDSLGDIVIEENSNGRDSVLSFVNNYTLSANVEDLYLSSTSNVLNGTGNSLDNNLYGNEFNNALSGGLGNDYCFSSFGDDTLIGGKGNDFLVAFNGNDRLDGGSDNDLLIGGLGSDNLTGGTGKDTFAFDSVIDGIDTIKDFRVVDDLIRVSWEVFGGGLTAGVLKAEQFCIGASAKDSSDRFIYNKSTGAVYFDSDGIGGLAQIQLAQLSKGLAMTHQNFYTIE